MIYLLYNLPMPYGIKSFKLDTTTDKIPIHLLNMAVLIVEGRPETVIKDRFGLFDSMPPSTPQEVLKWLPR